MNHSVSTLKLFMRVHDWEMGRTKDSQLKSWLFRPRWVGRRWRCSPCQWNKLLSSGFQWVGVTWLISPWTFRRHHMFQVCPTPHHSESFPAESVPDSVQGRSPDVGACPHNSPNLFMTWNIVFRFLIKIYSTFYWWGCPPPSAGNILPLSHQTNTARIFISQI